MAQTQSLRVVPGVVQDGAAVLGDWAEERGATSAQKASILALLDLPWMFTQPLPRNCVRDPTKPDHVWGRLLFPKHISDILHWTRRLKEGDPEGFSKEINLLIREVLFPEPRGRDDNDEVDRVARSAEEGARSVCAARGRRSTSRANSPNIGKHSSARGRAWARGTGSLGGYAQCGGNGRRSSTSEPGGLRQGKRACAWGGPESEPRSGHGSASCADSAFVADNALSSLVSGSHASEGEGSSTRKRARSPGEQLFNHGDHRTSGSAESEEDKAISSLWRGGDDKLGGCDKFASPRGQC